MVVQRSMSKIITFPFKVTPITLTSDRFLSGADLAKYSYSVYSFVYLVYIWLKILTERGFSDEVRFRLIAERRYVSDDCINSTNACK